LALAIACLACVGAVDASLAASRDERLPVQLSAEAASALGAAAGDKEAMHAVLENEHGASAVPAAASEASDDFVVPTIVASLKAEAATPAPARPEHEPVSAEEVEVPAGVDSATRSKLSSSEQSALDANTRVFELMRESTVAHEHAADVAESADDRIRKAISRVDLAQDEKVAADRRHPFEPKASHHIDEAIRVVPLKRLAYASEEQRSALKRRVEGVADAASFQNPLIVTKDTCHNGKKDDGELEVDCGGPCPPCGANPLLQEAADRVNADPAGKHPMHSKPSLRNGVHSLSDVDAHEVREGTHRVVRVAHVPVTFVHHVETEVPTQTVVAVATEDGVPTAPVVAATGPVSAMPAGIVDASGADTSDLPEVPAQAVEATKTLQKEVEDQVAFLNSNAAAQVAMKHRLDVWDHSLQARQQALDAEEQQLMQAEQVFASRGGVPNIPEAEVKAEPEAAAEPQAATAAAEAEAPAEEEVVAEQPTEEVAEEAATASAEQPVEEAQEAPEEAQEAPEAEQEAPEAEQAATAAAAEEDVQEEAVEEATGATGSFDSEQSEQQLEAELAAQQLAGAAPTEEQAAEAQAQAAPSFRRTKSVLSKADADYESAQRELQAAEATLERLEDAGVSFLQMGDEPAAEGEGEGEAEAEAPTAAEEEVAADTTVAATMSAEEKELRQNLAIAAEYASSLEKGALPPGATGASMGEIESLASLSSGGGEEALVAALPPEIKVQYDRLNLTLSEARQRTEMLLHKAWQDSNHTTSMIANATADAARLRALEVEGEKFAREQLQKEAVVLEEKAATLQAQNAAEQSEFDALWEAQKQQAKLEEEKAEQQAAADAERRYAKSVAEVMDAAAQANATAQQDFAEAAARLAEERRQREEELRLADQERALRLEHEAMLREHIEERRNVTSRVEMERRRREFEAARDKLAKADEKMEERRERFRELEAEEEKAQKTEDAAVREKVAAARKAAQEYMAAVEKQEKSDQSRLAAAKKAVEAFLKESRALEVKEEKLGEQLNSIALRRQQIAAEVVQHQRSLTVAEQQESELEARVKALEEQERLSSEWNAQAARAEELLKKMTKPAQGTIKCDDGSFVFDASNCVGGGEMARAIGEERAKAKEEAEKAAKDAKDAREKALQAVNEGVMTRLKASLTEAQSAAKLHAAKVKELEAEAAELLKTQQQLMDEDEETEQKRQETVEKRREAEQDALVADEDAEIQVKKLRESRDRLEQEEEQALHEQQERNATRQARRRERMDRLEAAFEAYNVSRAAEVRRLEERRMELDEVLDEEKMEQERETMEDHLSEEQLNRTLSEAAAKSHEAAEAALVKAEEALRASEIEFGSRVHEATQAALAALAAQRDAALQKKSASGTLEELEKVHEEQRKNSTESMEQQQLEHEALMEERKLQQANETRIEVQEALANAREQVATLSQELEKDLKLSNEMQLVAMEKEASHAGSDAVLGALEQAKHSAIEAKELGPLLAKAKHVVESNLHHLTDLDEMYVKLRIEAAEKAIAEIKAAKAAREHEAKERAGEAQEALEAATAAAQANMERVHQLLREAVERALENDLKMASDQEKQMGDVVDEAAKESAKESAKQLEEASEPEPEEEEQPEPEAATGGAEEDSTGATGSVEAHRFARASAELSDTGYLLGDEGEGEGEEGEMVPFMMGAETPYADTDGVNYTPDIPDSVARQSDEEVSQQFNPTQAAPALANEYMAQAQAQQEYDSPPAAAEGGAVPGMMMMMGGGAPAGAEEGGAPAFAGEAVLLDVASERKHPGAHASHPSLAAAGQESGQATAQLSAQAGAQQLAVEQRRAMRSMARAMSAASSSDEAAEDEVASDTVAGMQDASSSSVGRRLLGLRGGARKESARGPFFRFRQLPVEPADGAAADAHDGAAGDHRKSMFEVASSHLAQAQQEYEHAEKALTEARSEVRAFISQAASASEAAVKAQAEGLDGETIKQHMQAAEDASARARALKPIVTEKRHAAETASKALEAAKGALEAVEAVVHPHLHPPAPEEPEAPPAPTGAAEAEEAAPAAEEVAESPEEVKAEQEHALVEEVRKLRLELELARRQEARDVREETAVAEEMREEALQAAAGGGNVPPALAAVAAAASQGGSGEQLVAAAEKELGGPLVPPDPAVAALNGTCPCAVKPVCACKMQKRPCGCKGTHPCACEGEGSDCPCNRWKPCGCANVTAPAPEPMPVPVPAPVPEPEVVQQEVQQAEQKLEQAEAAKEIADNSTIEATIIIHRYPNKVQLAEAAESKEKEALEKEAEAEEELAAAKEEEVLVKKHEVSEAVEAEEAAEKVMEEVEDKLEKIHAREAEDSAKQTLTERVDELQEAKKEAKEAKQAAEEKELEAETPEATTEEVAAAAAEDEPTVADVTGATGVEAPEDMPISVEIHADDHVEAPEQKALDEFEDAAEEVLDKVKVTTKVEEEEEEETPAEETPADVDDEQPEETSSEGASSNSVCDPSRYQNGLVPSECPPPAPLRSIPFEDARFLAPTSHPPATRAGPAPPTSIPTELPTGQLAGGSIPNVAARPSAQLANEPVMGDEQTWSGFNSDKRSLDGFTNQRAEKPFGTELPPPSANDPSLSGVPRFRESGVSLLKRVARSFFQVGAGSEGVLDGASINAPYSGGQETGADPAMEAIAAEARTMKQDAISDAVTDTAEAASISSTVQEQKAGAGSDPRVVEQAPASADMARQALDEARTSEQAAAQLLKNQALDATVRQRLAESGAEAESAVASDSNAEREPLPPLPPAVEGDPLFEETRQWLEKYDPDRHPGVAMAEASAQQSMAMDAAFSQAEAAGEAGEGEEEGEEDEESDGLSLQRMQDEEELQAEQSRAAELQSRIEGLQDQFPEMGDLPNLNEPMP